MQKLKHAKGISELSFFILALSIFSKSKSEFHFLQKIKILIVFNPSMNVN